MGEADARGAAAQRGRRRVGRGDSGRGAGDAELTGPATFALVAREGARAGTVVGLGTAGEPPAGTQRLGSLAYPGQSLVVFRSCDPAAQPPGVVPAGTYDLVAALPLARASRAGAPDPVVLGSEPVPLTFGDVLHATDRAPALPECGASELAPATISGGLGIGLGVEPGAGLTAAVTMTGSAAFADVRWTDIGWIASRDGVVVARGSVPVPQGPGFTVLPGMAASGSVVTLDLRDARDCVTGEPLWDAGPAVVQVRGVLRIALAPGDDGSTPTLLPLLSGGQWYTVDLQPVPESVPVLGEGQPRPAGVLEQTAAQVEPTVWRVQQTWASADTYRQVRDALVAAGFTESSEQLSDLDGRPVDMASGRFSRPDGVRLVVVWNTTSGDGTFAASWSVEVP